MNRPIKRATVHKCDLINDSNSCLPKLPPQAGKLRRIFRSFLKLGYVSRKNPRCQQFWRSEAAITSEKKRHVRSPNWYIIHPYSQFGMFREIIVALAWIYVFFKDPFAIAYLSVSHRSTNVLYNIGDILTDAILGLYILSSFFAGYHVFKTKEVVLDQHKIILNYIKSYFIFDFFGLIPVNNIAYFVFNINNKMVLYGFVCTKLLKFVRLKTMLNYFRQITHLCGIKETMHEVICLVLMTFYLTHWWTCIVYIVPKLKYFWIDGLSMTSWTVHADFSLLPGGERSRKYFDSLLMATSHFYLAGTGLYKIEEWLEELTFAIVQITGMMYFAYILVVVFAILGSTNASETKYEEIMAQIQEFMVNKKLPLGLRKRLNLYYENRFQKHYFRETAILSTLSEHLRHEVFLHCTKTVLEKVELFRGMSKIVIGDVVSVLRQDIFLPNDVIYKAGGLAEAMYFIVTGTIAAVMPNGKELFHMSDGQTFGEVALVLKQMQLMRTCTCTAVEITEALRIDRKDLYNLINTHNELKDRIIKMAHHKYQETLSAITSTGENEATGRRDLLYELRTGKVLTKTRKRHLHIKQNRHKN